MSNTTIFTRDQLTEAFTTAFLSTNPTVTKVSPNSVYASLTSGIASLAQKTLKENALIESYIDPDQASGDRLNQIALQRGVPARQATGLASTVWARIVSIPPSEDNPTIYTTDMVFTGSHGIRFRLQEGFTVTSGEGGAAGDSRFFSYRRLVALSEGELTNVPAFTITRIEQPPAGHIAVVNDVPSFGGRDAETDDQLRYRIKNYANITAFNTIAKISILANAINDKVFRVYNLGKDATGKPLLGVITHNGEDLLSTELDALTEGVQSQVSLADSLISFTNLTPNLIALSARLQLREGANAETVFNRVYTLIDSYLRDLVYRAETRLLDWVQLYNLITLDPDILTVSSDSFQPNGRIDLSDRRPVRLAAADFRDLNGNTLYDIQGGRFTTYYDEESDFNIARNFIR